LEQFGIEAGDSKALIRADGTLALPFESCMDVVLDNAKNRDLLSLFLLGQPAPGHHVLADLMQREIVLDVYTTNFDCLIETALATRGLYSGVHYELAYDDSRFGNARRNTRSVVKLHGTAREPSTVRATLPGVASAGQSAHLLSAIDWLLREGRHERVLVIGYSCSDVFDIVPAIESITAGSKQVILIEHTPGSTDLSSRATEQIGERSKNNPFRNFAGWRLCIDADAALARLQDALGVPLRIATEPAFDWRDTVNTWAVPLRNDHRGATILAQLFYRISDIPCARKYYDRALAICRHVGDAAHEGAALTNIGLLHDDLDEHALAATLHAEALQRFTSSAHVIGVASAHANLGFSLAYIDPMQAIEHSRTAIRSAAERGFDWIVANALNNLGLAHERLGRYDDARAAYSAALAADRTNKQGEAVTLNNLSALEQLRGDLPGALRFAGDALAISSRLGYRHAELEALAHLSLIARRSGNEAEAQEYDRQLEVLVKTSKLPDPRPRLSASPKAGGS